MIKTAILIIDDDAHLRKTLADILKFRGYAVQTAASGGEGLSFLDRETVDLALIDLRLPDLPGLEVLDRIKTRSPLTETIILTGHAALDTAIEATNKGAFSYLQKPCDIDQLLLHIRRAVEKRRNEEALRRQLDEVERLNRIMVNRELKMEELRRKINDLEARLAEPTGGKTT
jgi:DNA-binding NtrC family response regulator